VVSTTGSRSAVRNCTAARSMRDLAVVSTSSVNGQRHRARARVRHDRCETSRWSRPTRSATTSTRSPGSTIDARPRGGLDGFGVPASMASDETARSMRDLAVVSTSSSIGYTAGSTRGHDRRSMRDLAAVSTRPAGARRPRKTWPARSMRDLAVVSTEKPVSVSRVRIEGTTDARPRGGLDTFLRLAMVKRPTGTIDARPPGGLDELSSLGSLLLWHVARGTARSMRDRAVVSTGSRGRAA